MVVFNQPERCFWAGDDVERGLLPSAEIELDAKRSLLICVHPR